MKNKLIEILDNNRTIKWEGFSSERIEELADEIIDGLELHKIEQEQEMEEKPNIEQISKCYSHQCDLVLKKFAERLKDKISYFITSNEENDGKISVGILHSELVGVIDLDDNVIVRGLVDEVLKEFVK